MYNMSSLDMVKGYKNYIASNIQHLALYRKQYKNYLNVIYSVLKGQYPIIANMRDGNYVKFNNYLDLYNDLLDLHYDPNEDIVYVNGLKFYGGKIEVAMADIFVHECYRFLPVRDKVVIDIGATIADSSIYFASRGAKKVIALEPNKTLFQLAKKNIEVNNFSDRIEMIQAACVDATGEDYGGVKGAESFTLAQIISKLELGRPEILKLAGCEYDVLLGTPNEIISSFSHIQIQYQFGYKNLKEKLEKCGFHVTFTGPTFIKLPFEVPRVFQSHSRTKQINNMFYGYIYARKK